MALIPQLAGQSTLTDTRCFSGKIAEVVETSPTDSAFCKQLNLLDAGIMQGKGFLNADTMRYLAHGICRIHGAVLALGDHSLKNLDTLLAALNDPDMHFHGIAGAEIGVVLSHLFQIDSFNYCAHNVFY
jgi:hypothetical protein